MNRIQGIKRRETFFPGNVRVRETGGEESSRIIEGAHCVEGISFRVSSFSICLSIGHSVSVKNEE